MSRKSSSTEKSQNEKFDEWKEKMEDELSQWTNKGPQIEKIKYHLRRLTSNSLDKLTYFLSFQLKNGYPFVIDQNTFHYGIKSDWDLDMLKFCLKNNSFLVVQDKAICMARDRSGSDKTKVIDFIISYQFAYFSEKCKEAIKKYQKSKRLIDLQAIESEKPELRKNTSSFNFSGSSGSISKSDESDEELSGSSGEGPRYSKHFSYDK